MVDMHEVLRLLDLDRHDVISVSLDVDPRKPEHQVVRPAYLIWLRNALRTLVGGLSGDAQLQAEDTAGRILSFVQEWSDRPSGLPGRGLAIFAAPHLWVEYTVPVPLPSNISYGPPNVAPLLDTHDAYEPYAILIVDHERARMLLAYLGETEVVEEDALELHADEWRFKAGRPPTFTRLIGVGAGRGAHAEAFEARVEHHLQGFWAGVAQAADRLLRDRHIEHLIISGSTEAASEVRRMLPEAAQRKVVGFVPLPAAGADLREIQDRTLPVAKAAHQRHEGELVQTLLDRAAHRDAVLGKAATFDALAAGQAMTVIVDRAAALEVREAVQALARRKGARITCVGGSAAARLVGRDGIGAMLRYRIESPGEPAAGGSPG